MRVVTFAYVVQEDEPGTEREAVREAFELLEADVSSFPNGITARVYDYDAPGLLDGTEITVGQAFARTTIAGDPQACIEVITMGRTDEVTFAQWADDWVQDSTRALEMAKAWNEDDEYLAVWDDGEGAEIRFAVTDGDTFRAQQEAYHRA